MPEVKVDRRPQHDLNMVYDEDTECLTRQPEPLLDDVDVQQGRIFWLPSKEEVSKMASQEKLSNEGLWRREVRRGHSSGAIDEGIYSHPVVVVSRPKEDNRYVHFLLITSFNGKRLDQVYAKAKDFHAGRRTWYLPVAPTASHPDAISKKTKKRFPTLALANGAVLRKNSYVDIRNVYKIDWTLLKEYTNPEASNTHVYRFERESCIKLLAKCKTLVEYEPGEQRFAQSPGSGSRQMEDESDAETDTSCENQQSIINEPRCFSPEPLEQPDFCVASIETDRIACPQPKAPPDSKERYAMEANGIAAQFNETVVYYLEQIPKVFHLKPSRACPKQNIPPPVHEAREAMARAWRDAKGAAAILVASV